MARRCKDWNRGLAEDLRDPDFAREFLLAAIDEGVSVQRALRKVVRAMGVTEFAAKVSMAGPNVLRAIDPRHNPTQDTLNRLLRPFRLRLSLAPLETDRRAPHRSPCTVARFRPPNVALHPRRFAIVPSPVGCKRVLGRFVETEGLEHLSF